MCVCVCVCVCVSQLLFFSPREMEIIATVRECVHVCVCVCVCVYSNCPAPWELVIQPQFIYGLYLPLLEESRKGFSCHLL